MAYDETTTEQSGAQSGDPDPAEGERAALRGTPGDAEREEIEAERKRRLDDSNRPDMAEVDNSHVTLPTVKAWNEAHPPAEGAGTSDPSAAFREHPPSEDEAREMAEERERRLDPANRPEGAEVDNTHRTFKDGHFVD